ncbi:MAG: hypothetical protein RR375_02010 [Bacilli bacterium]
MSKTKFLNELTNKLSKKKVKNIKDIVKYYDDDIKRRKKKERIDDIISSYGSIDKIVISNKKSIFSKFSNMIHSIKTKEKKDNILYKNKYNNWVYVCIYILLFFFCSFNTIILVFSIFCILDGVHIYGLVLCILSMFISSILFLNMFNNLMVIKKVCVRKYLKAFCVLFISFILGVSLFIVEVYKVNYVDNVSKKYSMERRFKNIKFDTDTFYVGFNSNYNTSYIVKYDDTLDNEINIETKYYECIYNYYIRKEQGKVYVSLNKHIRDIVSFYIENFKEDNIYNIKELERYTVTIYVNEKDKSRLKIEKSV